VDAYVRDSVSARRFSLLLMAMFALTAVALAAAGIYAVVDCWIGERTRELGIRAALGASPARLMRLVMRAAVPAAVAGLIAGLSLALAAARLLTSVLFNVAPTDLVAFVQVTILIGLLTLLACVVPAARVGRTIAGVNR
jgi:ABC-type lipoprotein release transport system permease subunit